MDRLSFIRNSNVRNFAKLFSANVVAQVIGLVVYPILTRMYAPEDFGVLNLFLSISGVLVIFSTAEYYNAIVLPKDRKEGLNVVYVCISILLFVVLLTSLSVIFAADIARLFDVPALAKYYWMMPILVLVSGGWNILNYWYIKNDNFILSNGDESEFELSISWPLDSNNDELSRRLSRLSKEQQEEYLASKKEQEEAEDRYLTELATDLVESYEILENNVLRYYGLRNLPNMFKNTFKLTKMQKAIIEKLPCELTADEIDTLKTEFGKSSVPLLDQTHIAAALITAA